MSTRYFFVIINAIYFGVNLDRAFHGDSDSVNLIYIASNVAAIFYALRIPDPCNCVKSGGAK